MAKDYYELLGVHRNASDAELKRAYRRLAHEFHPGQKSRGTRQPRKSSRRSTRPTKSCPTVRKRAYYDQFGTAPGAQGGPGRVRRRHGHGRYFRRYFRRVLRRRQGGTRAAAGEDLRYNLKISFEDAAFGTTTKIRVPGGSAARIATDWVRHRRTRSAPARCVTAQGQIRMQQGFFSISRTCSRCGGEGKIITDPCKTCKGRKRVERERTLSVKIPAGVETGTTIRLSRRRRTGHVRRASGRPLRISGGRRACVVPARRTGRDLRCSDFFRAGGARGPRSRCRR